MVHRGKFKAECRVQSLLCRLDVKESENKGLDLRFFCFLSCLPSGTLLMHRDNSEVG